MPPGERYACTTGVRRLLASRRWINLDLKMTVLGYSHADHPARLLWRQNVHSEDSLSLTTMADVERTDVAQLSLGMSLDARAFLHALWGTRPGCVALGLGL